MRSAFVSAIDAYLKQNNKYNKSESKVTYQDIFDSLVLVTNCFSTQTSYENQTKKAITNRFIQEAMTEFLKEGLEIYFIENKSEADKIAEQILINKRSREQAEKGAPQHQKRSCPATSIWQTACRSLSTAARRTLRAASCTSWRATPRSAPVKQGRDSEFQAIMPVRGKILNCLKADYDKIFKNDIITDLLKVLGCGVEVRGKAAKDLSAFDLDSLRWHRVIICTDADVDGFQIRTLILTMIYRLVPTLIEQGYVYIAESPLYEITYRDKELFCLRRDRKGGYP